MARPSQPSGSRQPARSAGRPSTPHARKPAGGLWTRPHLLGLQDLSPEEMRAVLVTARGYQRIGETAARHERGTPGSASRGRLDGFVVANLFFEDSTRTRMSFSLAARRLGAQVLELSSTDSSINKGETIRDTAANVAAMGVDAMVVRHRASGAAALVARAVHEQFGVTVVNAGDGRHEHPTQGLLDVYTISEHFGRLKDFDLRGLKIAIVGDVASSRVARSDIAAMTALGAEVVCVGPPRLVPRSLEVLGCKVAHDLDDLIGVVDAVNVLRIQFERHGTSKPSDLAGNAHGQAANGGSGGGGGTAISTLREYAELYGLSVRRVARMKKHAAILHPGPINRGVEMTAAVADGERSLVLKQVGHGIAVRMAVLDLCLHAARHAH
jgi:aspartate carbamoyltransferase catalytic subunit